MSYKDIFVKPSFSISVNIFPRLISRGIDEQEETIFLVPSPNNAGYTPFYPRSGKLEVWVYNFSVQSRSNFSRKGKQKVLQPPPSTTFNWTKVQNRSSEMKLGLSILAAAFVIVCALTPKTDAFGWEKVDHILKAGIADHTTPGLQALVADHTVWTCL